MPPRPTAALIVLLAAQPLAAQAPPMPTADEAAAAAASITREDVRLRIGVIAHDSMRGRATPSPGLDATARWMADEMRRVGLLPGGDEGGFIQRYAIETVALDVQAGGEGLVAGRDLLPTYPPYLPADLGVEAGVVVVSGSAGAAGGLRGADVEGRVVIVAAPSTSDASRDRATLQLVQALLALEPAALLVATDAGDGGWRAAAEGYADRRWPRVGDAPGLPVFNVRDRSLARALPDAVDLEALRAARGGAVTVRALPGRSLRLGPTLRVVEGATAPNVVGILPGSDPALRDQHIVFSAHMDHVGVGAPDATGDSIFNGADDDASGTATVVELAEAFASLEPRPRRSIIFLGVSGEEEGLWGSDYFARHAPVPTEAIVANINIDMIGRNWPDTIVAIGREHSDLGATLDRVNADHPELGLAVIDDPWPEESFYTRSDHFNFARRGVPVLFFFSGTHEDYHRPSDEVELIDAEKTARIGRLLFWLGLEVANAPAPPRWDPESYRRIVQGAGG
ncbi:MAG: M20/M25/M40 family metallo-hydrolase [Gemmatimonadetes bacterium]|nr:M20/M25/M40 family metallo-hydrolase [Gemmatimonadota bacterium]